MNPDSGDLQRALRPSGSVRSGDQHGAAVIDLLRQVSEVLDQMWREDLVGARGDTAMRIGEASHCVHRALIALEPELLRSASLAGASV
jgi:hypothetical protein